MTVASRWILFTTIIVDARNHEPETLLSYLFPSGTRLMVESMFQWLSYM
jgi:hypothetical protein